MNYRREDPAKDLEGHCDIQEAMHSLMHKAYPIMHHKVCLGVWKHAHHLEVQQLEVLCQRVWPGQVMLGELLDIVQDGLPYEVQDME